jgi:hypothetical protein
MNNTPKRKYNVKKTSPTWLHSDEFSSIIIIAPNGWTSDDPNQFVSEKISRDEFMLRLAKSTFRCIKDENTK